MALFGNEVMRLRRTIWNKVQPFADEVFALLNGDIPITQDAPTTFNDGVTFNSNTGDFTTGNPVTYNTPVTNNGPTTYNGNNISNGPWTFDGPTQFNGSTTIPSTTEVQNPDGSTTPLSDYAKPTTPDQGSGVLYGTIVSGSGDTYVVQLINPPSGLSQVSVRFPNLSSGDKLPSGLFIAPIIPSGSDYLAPTPAPSFYAGTVVSGGGDTYQVQLSTIDGAQTTTVTVKIFGVDSRARLSAGYPLWPIARFGGRYLAQCPVWG